LLPVQLSDCLVNCHRDAVGKVQAADLRPDRNSQAALATAAKHLFRKPLGLPTEYQDVPLSIMRVRIGPLSSLGEIPMPLSRQVAEERLPIVHDLTLQELPIVKPGTAEVVVVEAKS
jgi:hypothetical protein